MSAIQNKPKKGLKTILLVVYISLQVWSLQVVPSRRAFEQISEAMEKIISFR